TGAGMALGMSKGFGWNADVKPALLGGAAAFPVEFPSWPVYDATEENKLVNVLRSKTWVGLNGAVMRDFEAAYAKQLGVNHCLGVSSVTSALYTILGALDIGPGDEVIIPVYT